MGTEAKTGEEALQHYGILGMRWGVRRTQAQLDRAAGRRVAKGKPVTKTKRVKRIKEKAEPSKDAQRARESAKKAKKGGPEALSNQELKQLNERLNLEQNYNRLVNQPKQKSEGKKFLDQQLSNYAQKKAMDFVKDGGVVKMIDLGIKATTPLDFKKIKL